MFYSHATQSNVDEPDSLWAQTELGRSRVIVICNSNSNYYNCSSNSNRWNRMQCNSNCNRKRSNSDFAITIKHFNHTKIQFHGK